MRFYTNQHPFYCGIDLHARSMYVCIVNHEGEILLHRNTPVLPIHAAFRRHKPLLWKLFGFFR